MRHQRKKRINKNSIMALFIVIIMTSSILGFVWTNITTNDYTYNGYNFKLQGDSFILNVDGKIIRTDYLPNDLNIINMSENIKSIIKNNPMIYVSFDTDSKNIDYIDKARFELTNELQKTNIYVISGKTTNSTDYDIPIITCKNATEYVPVIYLKEGNTTQFYLQNDCIIAESNSREGFIGLKDLIIYTIFEII